MRRYQVIVFNHNDQDDPPDAASKLVGTAYILARAGREAAALAYFRLVGRHRLEKLRELRAPKVIIDWEQNTRGLSRVLQKVTVGPGGAHVFRYCNGAESWYMLVTPLPTRPGAARQLALRAALFPPRPGFWRTWSTLDLPPPSRN